MTCGLSVPAIFPTDKTLHPASPSLQWVLWISVPHLLSCPIDNTTFSYRYYVPLRPPLFHLGSLRFRLVSQYLACFPFSSCSYARWLVETTSAPGPFNPVSPYLSGILYCYKEITVLSSSRTTPLCTCPARISSRWCPTLSPSQK
jgi:hypothetical protein